MKFLSDTAVRQYSEAGYYAPVPVLSTAEAGALRARLEAFEAGAGSWPASCATNRICCSPG